MTRLLVFLLIVGALVWYFYFDPTGPSHGEVIQAVKDSGLTADDRALVRARQIVNLEKEKSEEETNAASTGQ